MFYHDDSNGTSKKKICLRNLANQVAREDYVFIAEKSDTRPKQKSRYGTGF